MNGCQNCRKMQEAVGRAEVRAAQAEAGLKRQQKWWGAWMLAALLGAGFSVYLLYSFEAKKWLWYDFVVPARRARQQAPQAPTQAPRQQLLPSTQAAPRQSPKGQPTPLQRRRRGQR